MATVVLQQSEEHDDAPFPVTVYNNDCNILLHNIIYLQCSSLL
jgi:hypothetical protein